MSWIMQGMYRHAGVAAKMVLAICKIANPFMHLTFSSKYSCKMYSRIRLDVSILAILVEHLWNSYLAMYKQVKLIQTG